MEKMICVEVLDRRGEVRQVYRFPEGAPIRVGRAYDNEVILSDKYVCPSHLSISLDEAGEIVAEDLGSVNGTSVTGHAGGAARRYTLKPDTVLTLGHTMLRVRWSDAPVGPATLMRRHGFASLPQALDNPLAAAVSLVSGLALYMVYHYLSTFRKPEMSDFVMEFAGMLVFLVIWSGLWSLVSRLVTHSFRSSAHIALAGLAFGALTLSLAGLSYLSFLFLWPALFTLLKYLTIAGMVTLILYCHLSAVSSASHLRMALTSAAIAFVTVGIFGLQFYLKDKEFSNKMGFPPTLKPVDKRLLYKQSSEEFFAGLGEMKDRLDEAARKK